MTTDRTITLTAEQARRVLVGIGTTDDTRRAFAVTAMANALIVADGPASAAPAAPAPAPTSSARAELHALAPLPWTAEGADVADVRGIVQFTVSGLYADDDARLAELVAWIVNEPEPATAPVSDERTRAVDGVLAAARRLRHPRNIGERTHAVDEVLAALDALDGKNA